MSVDAAIPNVPQLAGNVPSVVAEIHTALPLPPIPQPSVVIASQHIVKSPLAAAAAVESPLTAAAAVESPGAVCSQPSLVDLSSSGGLVTQTTSAELLPGISSPMTVSVSSPAVVALPGVPPPPPVTPTTSHVIHMKCKRCNSDNWFELPVHLRPEDCDLLCGHCMKPPFAEKETTPIDNGFPDVSSINQSAVSPSVLPSDIGVLAATSDASRNITASTPERRRSKRRSARAAVQRVCRALTSDPDASSIGSWDQSGGEENDADTNRRTKLANNDVDWDLYPKDEEGGNTPLDVNPNGERSSQATNRDFSLPGYEFVRLYRNQGVGAMIRCWREAGSSSTRTFYDCRCGKRKPYPDVWTMKKHVKSVHHVRGSSSEEDDDTDAEYSSRPQRPQRRTSYATTDSEDDLLESKEQPEFDADGTAKLSNAQILNELKSKHSSDDVDITTEFIKEEYSLEDDQRVLSIYTIYQRRLKRRTEMKVHQTPTMSDDGRIMKKKRRSHKLDEIRARTNYQCQECGNFFTVKFSLHRHLATVHRGRPRRDKRKRKPSTTKREKRRMRSSVTSPIDSNPYDDFSGDDDTNGLTVEDADIIMMKENSTTTTTASNDNNNNNTAANVDPDEALATDALFSSSSSPQPQEEQSQQQNDDTSTVSSPSRKLRPRKTKPIGYSPDESEDDWSQMKCSRCRISPANQRCTGALYLESHHEFATDGKECTYHFCKQCCVDENVSDRCMQHVNATKSPLILTTSVVSTKTQSTKSDVDLKPKVESETNKSDEPQKVDIVEIAKPAVDTDESQSKPDVVADLISETEENLNNSNKNDS